MNIGFEPIPSTSAATVSEEVLTSGTPGESQRTAPHHVGEESTPEVRANTPGEESTTVVSKGSRTSVRKRKVQDLEDEDIDGLTSNELQKLVQIKQLVVLKQKEKMYNMKEEKEKLKLEVLMLTKEKLQWEKEKREKESGNMSPIYMNL